jgi:NADH:ubiquinone oxidoreductase subunit 3 (subunit A)
MATPRQQQIRVRTKSNEEVIREELRVIFDGYMKVWQTAMAMLPALMIALYWLRKEVSEKFVVAGKMKPGEILPIEIFLVGTLFLLLIGILFCLILGVIGKRYKYYRAQLESECDNHLMLPPPSRWKLGPIYFYLTILAFPLIDIVLHFFYTWAVAIDFSAKIVAR